MLSAQGVTPSVIEVKDFSGGMTDYHVAANSNQFQRADNFYINDDRKLVTRPGLVVADAEYPRIPTNKRINRIFDLEDQLFQISNKQIYYNLSGFSQPTTPSGNAAFNTGGEFSYPSYAKWNKHAFLANSDYSNITRLFKDAGTWKLETLGLPALSTTPTITGAAGSKSYLYAFYFVYQYTSQGVLFEEVGPVTYSGPISNSDTPDIANINISAIPYPVNSTNYHFNLTGIKVVVCRTQDSGDAFYKVGEVTNPTTTFVDNVSDDNLVLNETLYTTGDVPEHEMPPPARCIHSVNDVLLLGDVKEAGVVFTNRIRMSNRFMPWSCPGQFYEDFDDAVKGISSVGINPVVFCERSTYRLSGFYNPDGSGSVQKTRISDTIGCLAPGSIVQTNDGVFWCGNDGFYFTDGNRVVRVSESINNTYKLMTATANQRERITGSLDPVANRIIWTMQADQVSTDNDIEFVLHLQFDMKPTMPFTTWSGGSQLPNNFAPTCVHYHDGIFYHADTRGYLLKYDPAYLVDYKIDTAESVVDWLEATIIYDYRSVAFDFGSSAVRKWVPWIIVNADNVSSISLSIFGNNDNSGEFKELKVIKYKGSIEWGDYDIEWGNPTLRWNYFQIITAKRRFPAPGLRCSYKQLRFTNAYSEIETSEWIGNGTIDASAQTFTLDDSTKVLPGDILDHYLSLENDDYQRQYRILSRDSDTQLTVEDLGLALQDGSVGWKIKGYRRREILKVLSYVVNYSYTSQTQDAYKSGGGE